MGTTLYISLERPVPGLEANSDRVMLCRATDVLEGAAKSAGVRPLSSFYSYDVEELLALVDDADVREQMLSTAKPPDWFDAGDGLRTVAALTSHVAADGPILVKRSDVTARVLEELHDCANVLTAAEAAGVRFRMHPGE